MRISTGTETGPVREERGADEPANNPNTGAISHQDHLSPTYAPPAPPAPPLVPLHRTRASDDERQKSKEAECFHDRDGPVRELPTLEKTGIVDRDELPEKAGDQLCMREVSPCYGSLGTGSSEVSEVEEGS